MPVGKIKSKPASTFKSRVGCRTCKIRRVKCDETKPSCNRCLSASRVCDGYGIVIDPPRPPSYEYPDLDIYQQHGKSCPNILPKPGGGLSAHPYLKPTKAATFDLFRSRTVHEMTGIRSFGFWQNVVLPACYTEPAVFHASMAVAHASQWCQLSHSKTELAGRDRMRLDTINEYNKSIQRLQSTPGGYDNTASLRVTLITCVIFIYLELATSRFEQAVMHLNEGRKLLLSCVGIAPPKPEGFDIESQVLIVAPQPQSIEDALVGIFADLDLQSTYFGLKRPQLHLNVREPADPLTPEPALHLMIPMSFHSVQEVDRYLLILMNRCLRFVGQALDPKLHTLQNEIANSQREELCFSLKKWKIAYDSFCKESCHTMQSELGWEQHSALMLIQHSWLSVVVATSYVEFEETDYDAYAREFSTIVHLAAAVLPEEEKAPGGFSLDSGVVLPLSWTVLKYRSLRVRREALDLLTRAGRQGLWDPSISIQCGREVVMLEEGINDWESTNSVSKTRPEQDLRMSVPLENRVSKVNAYFDDTEYTILRMIFSRKIWSSDGEFICMDEIVRRKSYETFKTSI